MAWFQNTVVSVFVTKDDQAPETFVMESVQSSSRDPGDDNDGDSSRPSCANNNSRSNHSNSNSSNNNNNSSHIEDYKNERSKLAFLKPQKNPRLDYNSNNPVDESFRMSRNRLRMRKNHAEKVRRKTDQMNGIEGDPDVIDSCQVEGSLDSSEVEETSDSVLESSSNNKGNTLSSFISPPQSRSVQSGRGSKSTIRSIGTSSTTTTKKQSNSKTSKTRYSFNDLVENSAWVDAGKQRSESSERRKRRIRRHSHQNPNPNNSGDNLFHPQHSIFFWINGPEISKNDIDHQYPLTPNKSVMAKSRLARRRSDGDANDVAASASATRNKLRRRTRHSISGNLHSNTPALNGFYSPVSPYSSSRKTPRAPAPAPAPPLTPPKTTKDQASTSAVGFVTPYNVLRDQKSKSARSYSDRLMIAAESSKTPMASLRKLLRDEKDLSLPENVRKSEDPKLVPRMSKQMSQPILKIPFFDDDIKDVVKSNEKRGDNEADSREVKSSGRSQRLYKQMSRPLLNTSSSEDTAITSEKRGDDEADNREIRNPRRASRMFKQISQPFLHPFSDSTIKSGEKRGDDEADTNRAAQVVHALGKSVAKSMKKQAKNTKRKIGKQISKMAPQPTTPKAHFALDDTTESLSPLFDGNASNTSLFSQEDQDNDNDPPSGPLIGLKPPSGHCVRKECRSEESICSSVEKDEDNDEQNDPPSCSLIGLKPPSGHSVRQECRFEESTSSTVKKDEDNTRENNTSSSQLIGLRPPSGHCVRKDSSLEENEESISSFFENDSDNELHNSQFISPLAPLKSPSGHRPSESTSNKLEGSVQYTNLCVPPPPLIPEIEINHNKEIEGAIVSDDQKQGNEKRSRKKVRSKIMSRQKKNESKPKKKNNEQMESSMERSSCDGEPSSRTSDHGSSSRHNSFRGSPIIADTSDPHPDFDNNEEEDSSIETSSEMITGSNQNEKVDNGDLTIKNNDKECSHEHPYDISRAGCSEQESNDTHKNCSITEPKTPNKSQPVASKQFYASCDRSINSTISTFVSTVPTSPSRTQSKNNSETSYGNQNQNNDEQLEPNSNTNIENGQKQTPEDKYNSECMVVPIEEETNKIEKNKTATNIALAPFRENENPTEAENKGNNLTLSPVLKEEVSNTPATNVALKEEVSKEKDDDEVRRPMTILENDITVLEANRRKEARKDQRGGEEDLSTELFYLLKKENVKKKIGSKDKKDSIRERTHRHKKDMRRMRRKLQVIDMDITIDSDALDVSEISTNLNPSDRRKSAKPSRNSTSESGQKGGQVNSPSGTKNRKARSCSTNETNPNRGQYSPYATKNRKTRSRSTSERYPSSSRQIHSSSATKNRKVRSRSTSERDPSAGQIHSPNAAENRKRRSHSTSERDPSCGYINSPSVAENRKTRSRSTSDRDSRGGHIQSPSVAKISSTSDRDSRGGHIHSLSAAKIRKPRSRSSSDKDSEGGQLQSSTVAKNRPTKSRSRSESGCRGGQIQSPDVTKNRMTKRRSPRGGRDQSPNRTRGRKTRSIRRSSVIKSRNEQENQKQE